MSRPISCLRQFGPALVLAAAMFSMTTAAHADEAIRLLVFSKVAEGAYTHASIPDGVRALQEIGKSRGWKVDATKDAAVFNDSHLKQVDVVVFNNAAGNVLDDSQQAAFENFIRAGGGFVGIHAATDCEKDWPWYGELVGAYFKRHPKIQTAKLNIEDSKHPATRGLPNPWEHKDEWYDFRESPRGKYGIQVLINVDESTYSGGGMGSDHPIAWAHEYAGGRAFYTNLGHRKETYDLKPFRKHLIGGVLWAAGALEAETTEKGTTKKAEK